MQYIDRDLFFGRRPLRESATSVDDVRRLAIEASKLGEDELDDWIRAHGDVFAFAGRGSSRTALAAPDGLCVKLLRDRSMAQQQRAEVRNSLKAAKLGLNCFPDVVDWDRDGYAWLITRLCTEAEAGDFRRLYGYDLHFLMAGVSLMAIAASETGGVRNCLGPAMEKAAGWDEMDGAGDDYWTSPEYEVFETLSYYADGIGGRSLAGVADLLYGDDGESGAGDLAGTVVDVMTKIDRPENDAWRQLRLLVRFAATSGDARFALHDCWTPGNWGLALVDGRTLPVVLDSGYCPELEGA